MSDQVLCVHCGRIIIPAEGTPRGWRHVTSLFISCHPGALDTGMAEPTNEELGGAS